MPINQRTNLNENTVLALWKISESKEELLAMLNGNLVDNGTNLHSSIHWLASRVLLQELYPGKSIELHKDEFNKPSLSIDHKPYAISITHSYEYAAVMISRTHAVALDLERIDERVMRVAHKFIRDDEQYGEANPTVYNTIIWSAKETLYKYYGKKELDFKLHLHVHPFEYNSQLFVASGTIHKDNYILNLPVHIETIDGYVLTYSFGG
ncbi:MAG: 4'-phosphopantetheinyl transferase superfamily protein [Bacteroidota bacterium]